MFAPTSAGAVSASLTPTPHGIGSGHFRQEWAVVLPAAALAYRCTPHSVTRFSSFFLVTGQQLVLPLSRQWTEPVLHPSGAPWLHALWRCRLGVLLSHQRVADTNRKLFLEDPHRLKPGMHIALRITAKEPTGQGKLRPASRGPYVVERVLPTGATAELVEPISGSKLLANRTRSKFLDASQLSAYPTCVPTTSRGTLAPRVLLPLRAYCPPSPISTVVPDLGPHSVSTVTSDQGGGRGGWLPASLTAHPPVPIPGLHRAARPSGLKDIDNAKKRLTKKQTHEALQHKKIIYLHRRLKAYNGERKEVWKVARGLLRLPVERGWTPPPESLVAKMKGQVEDSPAVEEIWMERSSHFAKLKRQWDRHLVGRVPQSYSRSAVGNSLMDELSHRLLQTIHCAALGPGLGAACFRRVRGTMRKTATSWSKFARPCRRPPVAGSQRNCRAQRNACRYQRLGPPDRAGRHRRRLRLHQQRHRPGCSELHYKHCSWSHEPLSQAQRLRPKGST
ncbi:hypothetical protein Emag_007336 [Eimeria magna]